MIDPPSEPSKKLALSCTSVTKSDGNNFILVVEPCHPSNAHSVHCNVPSEERNHPSDHERQLG